jgi:hypothetical protein
MDEWKTMMKGVVSKLQRRGTEAEVAKAMEGILEDAAKPVTPERISHGCSQVGVQLSAKQSRAMMALIGAQRPARTDRSAPSVSEVVSIVHRLLSPPDSPGGAGKNRAVAAFREGWDTSPEIELWRTTVRRYRWIDLQRESIETVHTMSGKRSKEKTEEEKRLDIEHTTFFFTPDCTFVSRWELVQVLVLVFTAIIVPLRCAIEPRFPQVSLPLACLRSSFWVLSTTTNWQSGTPHVQSRFRSDRF